MNSISAITPAPLELSADRPRNLQQAAEAFEALLLSQMLRTARQSDGEAGDAMGSSILEMAEEYLARAIAQAGGSGLSAIIAGQLNAASHAHSEALNRNKGQGGDPPAGSKDSRLPP